MNLSKVVFSKGLVKLLVKFIQYSSLLNSYKRYECYETLITSSKHRIRQTVEFIETDIERTVRFIKTLNSSNCWIRRNTAVVFKSTRTLKLIIITITRMAAKHSHKKKNNGQILCCDFAKKKRNFFPKKKGEYIYINADKMYINVKKTF